MFKNYFMVAIRHLRRQVGYSFINIMGLTLGMMCCVLIMLFIRDELSYDRYHDKAHRTYRVIAEEHQGDQINHMATVLMPTAQIMLNDYPEIENMVRLVPPGNAWMVKYGDKGFYERFFYLADSTVFDVFKIPLLAGNPKTALAGNNKIVLSQSMAKKYFGDENPMGKVIDAEGAFHFEVTGIMEDLPPNTHMKFNILASLTIQEAYSEKGVNEWGWRDAHHYVVLREGADPSALEAQLPAFVQKYLGSRYSSEEAALILKLQPVTDIHLHSHLEGELAPNSDIAYVYLFAAIAVFILIIACINFMNLATARSAGRAREIGLRKVVGAHRSQVVQQFLSESLVLSGIAVVLSFLLVVIGVPWFNALIGKSLIMDGETIGFVIGAQVIIGAIVGFLSGSYPALYLSAFEPIQVLKGSLAAGAGNSSLRKVLVITQFAISIALLICTGIVYNQLNYISSKNMGLSLDQVVAVPLTFDPVQEKARIYKERALENPYVLNAAVGYMIPGYRHSAEPTTVQKLGADGDTKYEIYRTWVDEGYAATFDMEMVAGRYFDHTYVSDESDASVINEAAVKKLGYASPEEAIGQQLDRLRELRRGYDEESKDRRTIIGVVKDFHYTSLHEPIEPLMLFPTTWGGHVAFKINAEHMSEGLAFIEEAWYRTNPDFAFEYFFIDETFAQLYDSERRLGQIFTSFALLAVVIACLGLFGLASFTAERRTKEIGIRKVLGASVPVLFQLLSTEFVKLVIIANLIAWPIAYFVMDQWLEDFAYRIQMNGVIFILAGIIGLAITLLTVGYQALKVAISNPVHSLRNE